MPFQPTQANLPNTIAPAHTAFATAALFFDVPDTTAVTMTQPAPFAYRILAIDAMKGPGNGGAADQVTILNGTDVLCTISFNCVGGTWQLINAFNPVLLELRKGAKLKAVTVKDAHCNGLIRIQIVPIR